MLAPQEKSQGLEMRLMINGQHFNIDKMQALQIKHQDLAQKAFGYEHMKPKHHARFHWALQIFRNNFHVDCFPCEKKHRLYKSHIGLSRFDPWARSTKGQFSHLVLREMWEHHLEALKVFKLGTSLVGQQKNDCNLAMLFPRDDCKVSAAIQHCGRTISHHDVILGEYPGKVIAAVQSGEDFFLQLQILVLDKKEEFHSYWKVTQQMKLLPVCMAGRSPSCWLDYGNDTFLCLH